MDWSLREGYAWAEDKEHCEEYGRMLTADPSKVSKRAKKRGLPQLGTLGAGNHYAEIQIVDEVYDKLAADRMGIRKGQVCVMIHSGSRGLGHQVATDALVEMELAMARDSIITNDRQLACARIGSTEGQNYLKAMAAAANYAWVNRSSMTFLARQVVYPPPSAAPRIVCCWRFRVDGVMLPVLIVNPLIMLLPSALLGDWLTRDRHSERCLRRRQTIWTCM